MTVSIGLGNGEVVLVDGRLIDIQYSFEEALRNKQYINVISHHGNIIINPIQVKCIKSA